MLYIPSPLVKEHTMSLQALKAGGTVWSFTQGDGILLCKESLVWHTSASPVLSLITINSRRSLVPEIRGSTFETIFYVLFSLREERVEPEFGPRFQVLTVLLLFALQRFTARRT